MDAPSKSRSRRAEIRRNRPEVSRFDWHRLTAQGVPGSLGIAAAFCVLAFAILLLRQDVIPYRPDQPITHDIVSRVEFSYSDKNRAVEAQQRAFEREPRVFSADEDIWDRVEKDLLALPERVSAGSEPPPDLKEVLDAGALTALRHAAAKEGGEKYLQSVAAFVRSVRDYRNPASSVPLVILPDAERREDLKARREIRIGNELVDSARTYSTLQRDELRGILLPLAEQNFPASLQGKIADFAISRLSPTHRLDAAATAQRRNQAVEAVPPEVSRRTYARNEILVSRSKPGGVLDASDVQLLRSENEHYLSSLHGARWKPLLGVACMVVILTVVLGAYVWQFQRRVVTNHARGGAIAGLLLSMLLLAQLAGTGNGPIHLFAVTPTILVAMILTIAYDKRFSMGIAGIHGLLVTVALSQGVGFFVILWVGVLTCCFFLDEIRTRSKLIEIGGMVSIAMIAATAGAGLLSMEAPMFIFRNCLFAGAAGLAAGFIVLGILPFIEKAFRITTSMTLLELADASQPLIRRLAMEAPGTYAHSLQVATLAEAAAESIGANSLLTRVGAWYHDVGKMNKADYFIENQGGGENRHLNLTPNVSLLIIIGHVKDGVELAREYNLPTSLVPFIQQHHGTTLVEYFYDKACTLQETRQSDEPAVSDTQYRYPGPKPRSKEVAIVMLSDAVESASRCMGEANASRVETLVHDLAMKRLVDGQFDDCDLTMRDLEKIERALVKTLLGLYHGRIAYPPSRDAAGARPHAAPVPAPPYAGVRMAQ